MAIGNLTGVSQFLLLGVSEELKLQPVIFGLFLSMYLITVFGNLLIILAVSSDSHLHTPMYFFLSNLSFVDICFTSTIIPKMLWNIQTQSKVITYEGCITQVYFFTLFAGLDILLLTVMAYDRFMAICHPLHYMVTMNPQICGLLVLVSWVISVLHSLLESLSLLRLSLSAFLEIPHFFCELNQMIQLASSDTFLNNVVMYSGAVLLAGGSLPCILYSYSRIVSSIGRISSSQGKYKAFSTCASHLSVVSLFYCTGLGVYLSSAGTHSFHSSATASVMYTVVTPMLNPFIYSLRNKDLKKGLKKLFGKIIIKSPIGIGLKKCLVTQSCPTLCDPLDCSPPGSVHRISQAVYWSELPHPPPRDLPEPGIKPISLMAPELQVDSLLAQPSGKPNRSEFSWLITLSLENRESAGKSSFCPDQVP